MDNSIGEEGTTNNKFDEVSITNDKIVKEREPDEPAKVLMRMPWRRMRQRDLPCQEDCAE